MVRYLSQEEKMNSRTLWKEAFPEDSRTFDDYYFQEKIKDNRILVRELEGEIVSMIHQNPYGVSIKGFVWDVDYIVGVATSIRHRKQGHMRALLCHMLAEMNEEGQPFCFLMPADERIYLPFDFSYIFDQPQWKEPDLDMLDRRKVSLEEMANHAAEIDRWLSECYQVYCLRDERYMESLRAELASENGECYFLYDQNGLCGLQSFWGIEKREQRELIFTREWNTKMSGSGKPAIMGRIVHLENFLEHICLKKTASQEQMEVMIEIEDKLIPSNHGVFCWTLDRDGSGIQKKQGRADLKLDISQLTQWLFGYKPISALADLDNRKIPEWCDEIQVLNGVFLDEVV